MSYMMLYSRLLNSLIQNNKNGYWLLKSGILIGKNYVKYFPDKRLPRSFQYLHEVVFDWTYKGIASKSSVWVNLFAPSEILLAFGFNPIFVEAISAFLSGLDVEDELILRVESQGISESFCTFHKAFLGAAISNLLKKPKFLVATSSICDANLNTFRFLSETLKLPFFFLDVPSEDSKEARQYLKAQLSSMIKSIEKLTGRKLNLDYLAKIIKKENVTKKLIKESLKLRATKNIKTTLTFEMFMLYPSHVFCGTDQALRFYQMFVDDLKNSEERDGKSIFFIHTLPIFEENFKEYFNFSNKINVLGMDLNFDFLEEINEQDPIEAICEKLLKNPYNGDFKRRFEHIKTLIEVLKPDGVLQICQMGCKQSIGCSMLLKSNIETLGIPFTSIDVDCVNKKNNSKGQIRTRLEAFLERVK
ncbi:2-hydroxyglutaryl-CoA dehydratase D-component [Caldicellulosiruptor acetigenus I77R1B]|uniref:2-hydroxyglutaryl-CoA dehydratase D-component n=1 Tax=Caldicellulosiruptor acetigenus (strain ATCC 700853 / DSM 12137 / I77R1B) TaxID=632335 RepID=E4S6I6_CALA7|nr:2-hydroxyacyl-CoA dehydratase family protein [Caldicellulosiruptor acetigenus]ADQ39744.1 2-hydroxyglutaryl-CoA dehydratase D-component [Caldicellulosiruptor acetigenus I77R1B]WAM36086.1 2-hydroxyacyl-CoA dehydratase family protein [Caldicellulosiruptor acetigenus]